MPTNHRPNHVSWKRGKSFAIATLAILATTAVAWAAAGGLDLTFGSGGVVQTDGAGKAMGLSSAIVQPDGRIVACGYHSNAGGGSEWWVRRYNADGTDDSSFGNGGLLALYGAGSDYAARAAVDSYGRIVVVGHVDLIQSSRRTYTHTYYSTLVRLNPNGSLNTSFGSGGVVSIVVPGALASATSPRPQSADERVILQADGRIVVSGLAYFAIDKKGTTRIYPFLARYNADGSPDSSFGSGGFSVDRRATEDTGIVRGLARQSTGCFVMSQQRASVETVITRYLPGGSVDTGFSPILLASDVLFGISVDRFDRIVGAGRLYPGNPFSILVRRFTADGGTDTSFASGGSTLIHVPGYDSALAHADPVFQADDRIVLGATLVPLSSGTTYLATTVRLLDNGLLDGTYGTGGIGDVIDLGPDTAHTGWDETADRTVLLAPDGSVILAGNRDQVWYWMIARFNAN